MLATTSARNTNHWAAVEDFTKFVNRRCMNVDKIRHKMDLIVPMVLDLVDQSNAAGLSSGSLRRAQEAFGEALTEYRAERERRIQTAPDAGSLDFYSGR